MCFLVITLFLVGCNTGKAVSDAELEAELSQLSTEELDAVIADAETESSAVAGQAIKSKLSPPVSGASKAQIAKVANKVKLDKVKSLLIPPQLSCVNSPGLVHLWKGEDSGDDSVGGAELVLKHGTTYTVGKSGKSFYFDGVDDYASATINLLAEGLTVDKISVEMWVNPEVIDTYTKSVLFRIGGVIDIFILNNGDAQVGYGSRSYLVPGVFKLNEWTHLFYVNTGSTLQLYVNGALRIEIIHEEQPHYIDNQITLNAPPHPFKGKIDEVAIYNDVSSCIQNCGNGNLDIGEECDSTLSNYCSPSCTFTSEVQKLKVLVVKTCNTDGTLCSSANINEVKIKLVLNDANKIYERSGSNFRFIMDSETNFDFISSTLLNSICLLQYSPSAVEQITTKDLNGDGKFDGKDNNMICDSVLPATARTDFSLQHPNSIVVYPLGSRGYAAYDDSVGHWVIKMATGGASSCKGNHIYMPASLGSGTLFAHESGHYFCTSHTFRGNPKNVAEAAAIIKGKIEAGKVDKNNDNSVKNLFDGEYSDAMGGIPDTPADPGVPLFRSIYSNECDPDLSKKIEVPVLLEDGTSYKYVFQPDRTNIMSYFKGCNFPTTHFSLGQVQRHYQVIKTTKKSLAEDTKVFIPNKAYSLSDCYLSKRLRSNAGSPGNIIGISDSTNLQTLNNRITQKIKTINDCNKQKSGPSFSYDNPISSISAVADEMISENEITS